MAGVSRAGLLYGLVVGQATGRSSMLSKTLSRAEGNPKLHPHSSMVQQDRKL